MERNQPPRPNNLSLSTNEYQPMPPSQPDLPKMGNHSYDMKIDNNSESNLSFEPATASSLVQLAKGPQTNKSSWAQEELGPQMMLFQSDAQFANPNTGGKSKSNSEAPQSWPTIATIQLAEGSSSESKAMSMIVPDSLSLSPTQPQFQLDNGTQPNIEVGSSTDMGSPVSNGAHVANVTTGSALGSQTHVTQEVHDSEPKTHSQPSNDGRLAIKHGLGEYEGSQELNSGGSSESEPQSQSQNSIPVSRAVAFATNKFQKSKWNISPQELDQTIRGRRPAYSQPTWLQTVHEPFRGRDEARRLQSMLTKVQRELLTERQAKSTIYDEVKHDMSNSLMTLFKEVLQKQIDVDKQKSVLRRKDIELKTKEERLNKLAEFLVEGQKQLVNEFEEHSYRTATELQLQHARDEGELQALEKFRDWNAHLADKSDRLEVIESETNFRAHGWRITEKESLEQELRDKLEEEIEGRISNVLHQNGFEEGKKASMDERAKKERDIGFIEGYKEARRQMDVLTALKNGSLHPNSADLDFLINSDHPGNPFNRGLQAGRQEEQGYNDSVSKTNDVKEVNCHYPNVNGLDSHNRIEALGIVLNSSVVSKRNSTPSDQDIPNLIDW
ncbi:hypothetical protein CC78DRAFT_606543 [Lojkania enalia]|uniref:Uncharacterized protein n=1 Tax=Lojkania enalia TaxID=147567 RepID=A0A9P4K4S1_9PLEO|nr:hypothetical protein CC78DRAFT_606543 [Didymosphaeria enalia]